MSIDEILLGVLAWVVRRDAVLVVFARCLLQLFRALQISSVLIPIWKIVRDSTSREERVQNAVLQVTHIHMGNRGCHQAVIDVIAWFAKSFRREGWKVRPNGLIQSNESLQRIVMSEVKFGFGTLLLILMYFNCPFMKSLYSLASTRSGTRVARRGRKGKSGSKVILPFLV